MLLDVLGQMQLPNDGAADFYVGLDDVTLTYCLPCNFDDLSEPGSCLYFSWFLYQCQWCSQHWEISKVAMTIAAHLA